ncbi:MAG: hypothetical protein QOH47_2421 [Sphingomonadales bacterium]|jgi:hypothetical protein|nr:hypothetical protein [Sphingomonadales bacterium]
MTAWPIINMASGLLAATILAYMLARKPERFTVVERVGMGAVGAGCILTIGPIMSVAPTPFEDWSGTLLRLGCAVYFVGRMSRHRFNNWLAVRQARRHLKRVPPLRGGG